MERLDSQPVFSKTLFHQLCSYVSNGSFNLLIFSSKKCTKAQFLLFVTSIPSTQKIFVQTEKLPIFYFRIKILARKCSFDKMDKNLRILSLNCRIHTYLFIWLWNFFWRWDQFRIWFIHERNFGLFYRLSKYQKWIVGVQFFFDLWSIFLKQIREN